MTKKETKLDKLTSQLEAQEAELQNTKSKLIAAEARIALLQEWLRRIFKPCQSCGVLLDLIDWNSSVYIFTCNDVDCRRYRQPAGEISKKQLDEILGKPLKVKAKEG